MVELLAGPLVGAAHMNKLKAKNWGNLVVAINPGVPCSGSTAAAAQQQQQHSSTAAAAAEQQQQQQQQLISC